MAIITCHIPGPTTDIATSKYLTFHQDHDHFFVTEYNRTHLNYWIPLVKPSRSEAGLRLVPWDRLAEKSPRLFNLCRRTGASSLHSLRDGGTLYLSDWSGVHYHEENLEIEEVMETPEVGPGDLLLLRVNTIHATQTTDDRRLAVSLRTCDPETPIDWHRVAGSSTMAMMQRLGGFKGNPAPNKLFSPAFQATQENDFGITLGDLMPTLTGERE
jgi:ectoine hydroxylase-related dioxygenase (phytanoyl-CoA dioxygenase family)